MSPSQGPISLTFDDGPDERWTRRVVAALRRCRARATFFVLGERVAASPATARALIDAGHDLQLHGHRHLRHTEHSEREIDLDTELALDALAGAGVRPTHWRTPWGVRTPATETVARRRGLTLVDWSIDTHDWRGDPTSTMLARARAELAPGAIVLMHDAIGPGALRSGCQSTVALVEPLVACARARGLSVEPLCSDRPTSNVEAHAASARAAASGGAGG
jgi:peptidoglycan-N-acetylglucosamine deacetylase